MSFLLDPPALFILGIVVGKIYYLMIVFGNRIFTRGASKKALFIIGAIIIIIFWAYSSMLYVDIIYFPWPFARWYGGSDWMMNSGLSLGLERTPGFDPVAIIIFASYPLWFYVGTELSLAGLKFGEARRMRERDRIVMELAKAAFPSGGAIPPGAADVKAAASVESFLLKIPAPFSDAMTLLLFVFDSRFLVFMFTGKWKRFVDLDARKDSTQEKRKYLELWGAIPFLTSTAQVLRITISYGYYTKAAVYKKIDYSGPLIPNLPPWYNPGPSKPEAARVDA